MEIEQLEAANIPLDQWTSLEGIYEVIGLRSLYVSPKNWQFFFSSVDSLFFLRKTKGTALKLEESASPREGWVLVLHNEENYEIELVEGGFVDAINEDIGIFHAVLDINEINGFFRNPVAIK